MTEHSLIGGSSAKRIIACPGSLALYRSLKPEDASSDYAKEGTMLHSMMALGCAESLSERLVGGTYDYGIVYTAEHRRDKILRAWEAWNEYLLDHAPHEVVSFEQEIRVSGPSIHPTAFGTADILGRHGNVLVVGDWKFGDGVMVEAEGNEQALFYAACALETPSVRDLTVGVEWVDLLIIQPQADREEVWDVHRVSVADVKAFAKLMRKAIKQADLQEPPMELGDHCRWCRVKLHCPLQKRGIAEIDANAIQPAALGELLNRCGVVEDFIKEVRAEAFKLLQAGHAVPGWKLVPKRGTRQWVDTTGTVGKLRKLGLTMKDLYPPELVSPAQAEKVLKAKGKDPKAVAALCATVSSGVTLAPDDDKRPAVPNLAALGKLVEGR